MSELLKDIDEWAKENNSITNLYLLESSNLDVEQKQYLLSNYSVDSVPTILFVKDGVIKETQIGYLTDDVLNHLFEGESYDYHS